MQGTFIPRGSRIHFYSSGASYSFRTTENRIIGTDGTATASFEAVNQQTNEPLLGNISVTTGQSFIIQNLITYVTANLATSGSSSTVTPSATITYNDGTNNHVFTNIATDDTTISANSNKDLIFEYPGIVNVPQSYASWTLSPADTNITVTNPKPSQTGWDSMINHSATSSALTSVTANMSTPSNINTISANTDIPLHIVTSDGVISEHVFSTTSDTQVVNNEAIAELQISEGISVPVIPGQWYLYTNSQKNQFSRWWQCNRNQQ